MITLAPFWRNAIDYFGTPFRGGTPYRITGTVEMAEPRYGLSLKQPWASLVVAGRKSIEVRSWPTPRRGPILIHAARIPDARAEAWAWVPPELMAATKVVGGIIGAAEITGCLEYRDADAFAVDRVLHLNEAAWFRPPVLYGFIVSKARALPFWRFPGNVKFFTVPEPLT